MFAQQNLRIHLTGTADFAVDIKATEPTEGNLPATCDIDSSQPTFNHIGDGKFCRYFNRISLTQACVTNFLSSPKKSMNSGGGNVIKEKHRIVVMGAAFVGKTQVVSQFLYDKFSNRYRTTIEELHRGEYELPDQSTLTLDILDTSGSFSFPAMQDLSISTSNAFLLVFSIDSEESWMEATRLREKVSSNWQLDSVASANHACYLLPLRSSRSEDLECRW